MQILYVVKSGDTIESIAQEYNITPRRLIEENVLDENLSLNVGQLIEITYPVETYIVQEGDSLYEIAQMHGVSVMDLLRNNSFLSDRNYLEVGEKLVLRYDNQEKRINVNGMTFSFIDEGLLRKTLPFLTYLTIMGHRVDINGTLDDIKDEQIIEISLSYGVVPLMLIYGLTDIGQGDPTLTHILFNNVELEDRLLNNMINMAIAKGYRGIVFGFQYVMDSDLQKYTNFIVRATERLHNEGLISAVVMIPDTFGYQPGVVYSQSYYEQIGAVVDGVILLSYQWTTTYIPEYYQTTNPYMREYVSFAVTQMPAQKIYLGITRLAYDWELPYVEGESFVSSLTDPGVLALANQYGSEILFDEETGISYFEYTVNDNEHIVWFKDARHTMAMLALVDEFGLGGISIWNIMYYFRIYHTINTLYEIEKVLPEEI